MNFKIAIAIPANETKAIMDKSPSIANEEENTVTTKLIKQIRDQFNISKTLFIILILSVVLLFYRIIMFLTNENNNSIAVLQQWNYFSFFMNLPHAGIYQIFH